MCACLVIMCACLVIMWTDAFRVPTINVVSKQYVSAGSEWTNHMLATDCDGIGEYKYNLIPEACAHVGNSQLPGSHAL